MIVRPFNVYGPGMQKHDYRVLPNFAAHILAKEPVNVYGTGKQTRTFCYITDAIRGFLQVLVNGVPGEPYNIGNPVPEITMLELVKTIERAVPDVHVDYRVIEHPDTYPADEPQRRCPDITKACLQVGYEPKVDLEDGLRRFFDWARKAYA
jgi:UDP-glucuronate decarboxylase